MIITLSGAEGSGKSTLAKALAQKLNIPRIYVGGIRRQLAKERGMTLSEFNRLGELDPSTDVIVDKRAVAEVNKLPSAIVEGRTMFHFFPNSIKIFLNVDLDEAAKRIFSSLKKGVDRNEGDNLDTVEAVKKSIMERRKSDIYRYKKYYDLNVFDMKHYDLVIDTTHIPSEQTLKQVMEYIERT